MNYHIKAISTAVVNWANTSHFKHGCDKSQNTEPSCCLCLSSSTATATGAQRRSRLTQCKLSRVSGKGCLPRHWHGQTDRMWSWAALTWQQRRAGALVPQSALVILQVRFLFFHPFCLCCNWPQLGTLWPNLQVIAHRCGAWAGHLQQWGKNNLRQPRCHI